MPRSLGIVSKQNSTCLMCQITNANISSTKSEQTKQFPVDRRQSIQNNKQHLDEIDQRENHQIHTNKHLQTNNQMLVDEIQDENHRESNSKSFSHIASNHEHRVVKKSSNRHNHTEKHASSSSSSSSSASSRSKHRHSRTKKHIHLKVETLNSKASILHRSESTSDLSSIASSSANMGRECSFASIASTASNSTSVSGASTPNVESDHQHLQNSIRLVTDQLSSQVLKRQSITTSA